MARPRRLSKLTEIAFGHCRTGSAGILMRALLQRALAGTGAKPQQDENHEHPFTRPHGNARMALNEQALSAIRRCARSMITVCAGPASSFSTSAKPIAPKLR